MCYLDKLRKHYTLVGGRDFPHQCVTALGPTQPSITMGTGSFSGVKRPGPCIDHLPHLAPR
jgi:hypothetical protein